LSLFMIPPVTANREARYGLISSFHSQSSAILSGSGNLLVPGFFSLGAK
jgi:hypothetical protein